MIIFIIDFGFMTAKQSQYPIKIYYSGKKELKQTNSQFVPYIPKKTQIFKFPTTYQALILNSKKCHGSQNFVKLRYLQLRTEITPYSSLPHFPMYKLCGFFFLNSLIFIFFHLDKETFLDCLLLSVTVIVSDFPRCPWDFPGKNTGVGCHFLLQGIFPTQESNPHLLHSQTDSLLLSHQGSNMLKSTNIWLKAKLIQINEQ